MKINRILESLLFAIAIVVLIIVAGMVSGCEPVKPLHYFKANASVSCICPYKISFINATYYEYEYVCWNKTLTVSGRFRSYYDNVSILRSCQ